MVFEDVHWADPSTVELLDGLIGRLASERVLLLMTLLWELKAVTGLAQLLRDRGRRMDARDCLAPLYGWFREGFDTRDLQRSKVLLDTLSHPIPSGP